MHDLLKKEVARAGWLLFVALVFVVWAAAGFPLPIGRFPMAMRPHLVESPTLVVLAVPAGVAFAALRWWRLRRQLAGLQQTQGVHFFLRAGAARRIHALLSAVAARDGEVGAAERDVVHAVLTRRLPEAVLPQDLRSWSASGASPLDPITHARHLATVLTPEEREALLQWCREVAAADGDVVVAEAELLRQLGDILRAPPPARRPGGA